MTKDLREYLYSDDEDFVRIGLELAPNANLSEDQLDEVLTRICSYAPNWFWEKYTRPVLETLAEQKGVCLVDYKKIAYGVPQS